MENQRQLFWNKAMLWGGILGIALVIEMLISYFAGSYFASYRNRIMYVLLIVGAYVSARMLRNALPANSQFPYKTALGSASATMLFAGFILGIGTFMIFTFDSGFTEECIAYTEAAYLESGMAEDMVASIIDAEASIISPTFMGISQFFGIIFWGFLFSLITSIFVYRKSNLNGFDQAMEEVVDKEE